MSLKQIAEMTGVSISTVSRVLNNREYNCASEEVKTRIWAAAKELQYVPNESARALKRGAAHTDPAPHRSFAVILERFDSLDDDPFFRELFRSVEQEAFACGCTICDVYTATELTGGGFLESGAIRAAKGSISKAPDGYIILGRSTSQTLEKLKKHSKHIVSISRNPTQFEIDEIICDGKAAAARAMEFLIAKGYRRIGYIGDCSYEDRYVGYCEAMIRNSLPLDYAIILPTDQTTQSGYAAMKKLLQSHTADAVLCANDATAIGALRAWNEHADTQEAAASLPSSQSGNQSVSGPQMPRKTDIQKPTRPRTAKAQGQVPALISIDDIHAAQEVTPALTTVHIPCEDMGKMAVKVLLDRMQRGHTEKIRVEFPSRLVVRESCR